MSEPREDARGIEIQTARKGLHLQIPDYDVRQPGRVLELQNRDLWLRPTDLSWHFHILMTIREEPSRNDRARSIAKLKTKEDKIEEAKKQETKRSADEWNDAEW